ncbi:MAG: prepilin-type N-terminal cleavage/methylation domain-containing protein [Planctomycetota bacterium]|nr:prepilin-type N-terminal cleavage/methylation domain-containing protein [Planctomycetota bacterium]
MKTTRLPLFVPSPQACRAGFTLMEILIALSIFGAGLVMAASLFPAGVSEHEKAVEHTLGTIMCNNGVAMARTQLLHDETTGVPKDANGILNKLQAYPSGNAKPLFQFMITCANDGPVDTVTGKYPNKYTITVTPYKGVAPFVGTPPPSLAVKSPLNRTTP